MKTRCLFLWVPFSVLVLTWFVSDAMATRPDVVFILSDDQGWTGYGLMGHARHGDPNSETFPRDRILYEGGYVTAPLCRPVLASIVTGSYPHQTGRSGARMAPGSSPPQIPIGPTPK